MKLTAAITAAALCAAAWSGLAQARTLDEIKASKTINIVTTAASPPHGFMDPASGTLKGVMVEVAQGVGKRLGVEVKLSDVPFAGLIPTLTSGRADLMSAPLFITEERARAVSFSTPVYGWGEGVVVSDKTDKKYARFDDLKGAKVGALVDSVQFAMMKDLPGTQVSTYQDYPSLLTDVRVGRVDLGIVDPPSIAYQIRSKGIPGVHLDESYKPVKRWLVGMAVQKDNAALLASVNAALQDMEKSGEIEAILKKWGIGGLAGNLAAK
ncbi:ABC transporter substrate-binding protein [Cupriavidus sp. 30B13]|uniref:ABC transporter substrate-binding protein n=1 Tax=Cupriavidus sp. 30B13 TaxID=3384241 RepID=UPI003B8F674A